jgi:hypothetical protein
MTYLSRKEKRDILFDKNPHCYYCGIETKDYPHQNGVAQPEDKATLEHLYPRYKKKRHYPKGIELEEKYVLSCKKCNEKRGEAHCKKINITKSKKGDDHTAKPYVMSILSGNNYNTMIKA